MKLARALILPALMPVLVFPALAQDSSTLPPVAIYQAMLEANRAQGWAQFRDFNGEQWIYFTPLQTLHCRLAEIRYSINSESLDQNFPLVECNPQNPFALPPDAGPEDIAIRLPLGMATSIAVQVVWEDGSESAVSAYQPCDNVGDQTCAVRMK